MIHLNLFGPGSVTQDDGAEIDLRGRKELALLAYLALESPKAVRRDTLLGLFWPELNQDDARNNLRVTLTRLRKALTHEDIPYLQANRRIVQWNADAPTHVDVKTFLHLIHTAERHNHSTLAACPACMAKLEQAQALYGAEMLSGFHLPECAAFEEWLLFQRESLHMRMMQLLAQLEAAYVAAAAYADAIKTVHHRLALDPLDEEAHRRLMALLVRNGQRHAALIQYEACRRLLNAELDVPPAPETVALYERIRSGEEVDKVTRGQGDRVTVATVSIQQSAVNQQPIVNSQQSIENNQQPLTAEGRPAARHSPPAPRPHKILSHLDPLPDQRLFGIEAAYGHVEEALLWAERGWLVAIDGIGGIGKTTLASALVRGFLERNRFADMAWVSAKQEEFRPAEGTQPTGKPALDAEALVDQLLRQLADGPYPLTDSAQKRHALTRLLQEKPSLIVVDNLETAIDYEALLPLLRELASPSKFLITSRLSLRAQGDVFCHSLTELSQNDALALLRHEAQTRGLHLLLDAPDEALHAIYNTVGGNPLALKLVMGQLHFLPLNQVLQSLRQARGQHVEQLYHYIYWQAWQKLDEVSRRLLLCLPVTPNATYAQLLTASELSPHDLQHALTQLCAYSLVEVGGDLLEPRYRLHRLTETFLMHEVIKWQQLPKGENSTLETADEAKFFLQRVLHMVEQWRQDPAVQTIEVQKLDREHEGIVKAISLGLEFPAAWIVVKRLIITFTPYMERRGHWESWRSILLRAITAAQQNEDVDGEITLTALLARLCQRQSRRADVVHYYRRVIRLARRTGNAFEMARACSNLGYHYIDGGHWWRAEVLCRRALAVFEELESDHGRAHTHNHLGLLYTRQHEWVEAEKHLQSACAIWEGMGDQHALIFGCDNLGTLYYETGRSSEALVWLDKAHRLAEFSGENNEIGGIKMNIGLVYRQQGDLDRAEAYFKEAEDSFQQIANLLGLAQAWANLGEIYVKQAKWSYAQHHLESALDGCRTLNYFEGEAKVLIMLIQLNFHQQDRLQAQNHVNTLEKLLDTQRWGQQEKHLRQNVLEFKAHLDIEPTNA
ncbi:MAG: BTAD domain-containing putative transcriptional regulator [Caldilineaceae bacterium]